MIVMSRVLVICARKIQHFYRSCTVERKGPSNLGHLLSASSSSSSVNNVATGGSTVRKDHWALQNSLPSTSQQHRDDHRARAQVQQQVLPTARYQLASGAATTSSTSERVTPTSTSSTTTIKASVKHEAKPQASTSRRQRTKSSKGLGSLRQRTNASSTSTSSSSSPSLSSPSSSSPSLAMLAPSSASLDPQADNVSTSSSATSESVVANSGYRQPPPTGGRHRRSEARESVARDSDAT